MTELLNHASSGYDSAPTIKTSPQCTKVLIYGLVSAAAQTNFFYVNYASLKNRVITFPASSIFDPASIGLDLQEDWLYVRQLASASQTFPGGNLEYVFALLLNAIPEVADFRNISSTE